MCRLLFVKAEQPFTMQEHLKQFATLAKQSKEYQGHGWGCAYLEHGTWKFYRSITPIWEDDLSHFNETTLLIAHARSAFKDEGIVVDNNMPFYDGNNIFIFNGELQGVRIKEEGRIGAEKIFNYIRRFDKGNMLRAVQKATPIINQKTRYVKAMNFMIVNKDKVMVHAQHNEDPDYFTMHMKKEPGTLIICSDPYPGEQWEAIPNNSVKVIA